MPKCTIDGKEIEVAPGTTVLQAALDHGIHMQYFCWHPDLPVDGNCRTCMIEVEKMPKLQIACNTVIADGMVIHTRSPKATEAQRTALEFLLVNHPIDCPVCDQAGECYLQDNYMRYGLYDSKVELEEKVHKRKVVDLGPIVLDAERCVLCSRCLRFEDKVTGTNSLQFVNRGDHTQIATFDMAVAVGPKTPVSSLQEMIAWVKSDPSRAAFGSPGAGTLPHFFGLLVGRAAGVELRHVPYKGSAATLTDLTAGHVPMVFTTISDLVEMHQAQRIRILATAGAERSPFLPDVPTFREAGFDIQGTSWYGAFAPAKTPRETIDRYSMIMAAAVRMPDVRERFLSWGLQPTGTSAAEFAAIQKADSERWAPAVKASGFSAD